MFFCLSVAAMLFDENPINRERLKQIYATAKQTPYQVYELTHQEETADTPKKVRFCILGCHGNAKENQKRVAAAMIQYWEEHPESKPDFVLFLGDNFYDSGVDNIYDPIFKTHFEDIYKQFKQLGIPTFSILGNHDENFHLLHFPGSEQGESLGFHQVAYSYRHGNPYASPSLILEDLPLGNMPSRAYGLKRGSALILCIDSSMYVKDYLRFLSGEDTTDKNQVVWLFNELQKAKAAGLTVMLGTHHGAETVGKRAYNEDLSYYLDKDDIQFFKKYFDIPAQENISYNQLLKRIWQHQQLQFDAIFAAHDHNLFYFNNMNDPASSYPICQITAGGGGGGLQPRLSFKDQYLLGCFLKRHGFVDVCMHENSLQFTIYGIGRSDKDAPFILEFTNESCAPIRHYKPDVQEEEKSRIEKLCSVIKEAIYDYLHGFLADKQEDEKGQFLSINPLHGNLNHGQKGVDRAHELWAYISQREPDDYDTTLKTIHRLSAWHEKFYGLGFTQPCDNSLVTLINKKVTESYAGKNLEGLLDEILPPLPQEKAASCNIL